jgi:hypothetical protein
MHKLTVVADTLTLLSCQGRGSDVKQVLWEGGKLTPSLLGLYRSPTALTSFELPGADPQKSDILARTSA